jgi:glycosyltransferase involved in cell wall biosynthesis
VPEVVTPGTGLLVPPGDPPALAEAVRALLDDPARRLAMGQAGRARMVARFDWRITAERTEAVYREAAGGRGGHPQSPGSTPAAGAAP